MKAPMIAPVRITKRQQEWLNNERERTGNPFAAIVRNLIQEQVEKLPDAGFKVGGTCDE